MITDGNGHLSFVFIFFFPAGGSVFLQNFGSSEVEFYMGLPAAGVMTRRACRRCHHEVSGRYIVKLAQQRPYTPLSYYSFIRANDRI